MQPLFLYLSHLAVHAGTQYGPIQAPKENLQKFDYIGVKNRSLYAGKVREFSVCFPLFLKNRVRKSPGLDTETISLYWALIQFACFSVVEYLVFTFQCQRHFSKRSIRAQPATIEYRSRFWNALFTDEAQRSLSATTRRSLCAMEALNCKRELAFKPLLSQEPAIFRRATT